MADVKVDYCGPFDTEPMADNYYQVMQAGVAGGMGGGVFEGGQVTAAANGAAFQVAPFKAFAGGRLVVQTTTVQVVPANLGSARTDYVVARVDPVAKTCVLTTKSTRPVTAVEAVGGQAFDIVLGTGTVRSTSPTVSNVRSNLPQYPMGVIAVGQQEDISASSFQRLPEGQPVWETTNSRLRMKQGGTWVAGGETARQHYLNGPSWMAYSSTVYDGRRLKVVQFTLPERKPGVYVISAAADVRTFGNCRLDFTVFANPVGQALKARGLAVADIADAPDAGYNVAHALNVSAAFYYPGGQGQTVFQASLQRVAGDGGWRSYTAGSRFELLYFPSDLAPYELVNQAGPNQTVV